MRNISLAICCLILFAALSVTAMAECNDTDGGRDYYVKGHFVGTNRWGDRIDVYDECTDQDVLVENFCKNNYLKRAAYDCSTEGKTCFQGICTSHQGVFSCEDDEPEKEWGRKGRVSFIVSGVQQYAEDDCSVAADTPNLLYEWYCVGDTAVFDEVRCDSYGKFCRAGTCVACTDTDNGQNYDVKGTVIGASGTQEDACVGGTTLQEGYCDASGQAQVVVDCAPRICSDGRCVDNPCQDDEPQKVMSIRGIVRYNGEVREDGCSVADATPNLLYEWYCDGTIARVDEIHCDTYGKICIFGKCLDNSEIRCVDSDPDNDPSIKGTVTIAGDTREDFCANQDEMGQVGCGRNNQLTWDSFVCSQEGTFCIDGVCQSCPEGTVYGGGRCGVPDYDGDGIPDGSPTCDNYACREDQCLDTSPGDAINDEGCSCEQGAEEVNIFEGDGYVSTSCEELRNAQWNELCAITQGMAGHCCNSIKDSDEFLLDCGGRDCGACAGLCNKIIQGGDLDFLFVPISYSSTTGPDLNNLDDWEQRAQVEANKLVSTPPFDGGQISIWRLDLFGYDQDFQDKVAENDIGLLDLWNIVLFKEKEYKRLCPSIDQISFLPSTYERSGAANLGDSNIVYKEPDDVNVITHETGHSFCGLDDEYLEDIGGFQNFRNTMYEQGSINCDDSPRDVVIDTNGTTELRCKWWDELPDAGCIPGCMYSQDWYRPKSDFEDSMMNSNYQVGPADFGKGTWNLVGYKRCKELVEQYGS